MRAQMMLVAVFVALLAPRAVQGQPVAILNVTAQTPVAAGKIRLTLASGTTITIPSSDLNQFMTEALLQALQKDAPAHARTPDTRPVAIPANDVAEPRLRVHCQGEWAGDFQMLAYCQEQQRTALTALRTRQMTSPDEITIRRKCAGEWPSDFQMQNYCEEQQLKALRSLGR